MPDTSHLLQCRAEGTKHGALGGRSYSAVPESLFDRLLLLTNVNIQLPSDKRALSPRHSAPGTQPRQFQCMFPPGESFGVYRCRKCGNEKKPAGVSLFRIISGLARRDSLYSRYVSIVHVASGWTGSNPSLALCVWIPEPSVLCAFTSKQRLLCRLQPSLPLI